ncbi:MAG: hypothetical protein E7510_14450 [Ruminococcus sp.]|nr:hypothetical protein [Ruminococcus sp.]
MPFRIIRNDITKVEADIIVNTANPNPRIGSGTDYAIYNAAGKEKLLAERKKIGTIKRGEIAVTPAFGLKAKYIIHAVGSGWIDGNHNEIDIVKSCYAKSLAKALELSAKSIAFPLISSGNYEFPKSKALEIAISEIGDFLLANDMTVLLVVFDITSFELSKSLATDIDEYIDSKNVKLIETAEYGWERQKRRIKEERPEAFIPSINNKELIDFIEGKELDDLLKNAEESFQEYLFKLIDERHIDDVTVYKKANITRSVFSQIRCKRNYKPKKTTAVALSISLKLDMSTMLKLLSKAGLAFSSHDKFDLIISYFVNKGIYDINTINTVLFKYEQPLLGAI